MKIVFLGDVMPGGVLHYQTDYASDDIKSYLANFDLRIATLESAVGDDIPFDEEKMGGKMNIIYSKNADLAKVKELNINVVSLANNHVFDLGREGLENTISLLEKYDIKYCGAGLNLNEASKPAVVKLGDKSIAIFAYCQYGTKYIGHVPLATETSHGINPLDIDRVISDIKNAKKIYDYVIIMPHWGIEYTYLPTVECKEFACKMIDAGADAVVGGHTHQIQPVVFYKNRPICYSLSNFMFPDYYMQPPRPMWYPDEQVDRNSIERVEYYPNYIEKPCTQVWRDVSRISIMFELLLSNIEKSTYKYSYLTSDNIITFLYNNRASSLERRMFWMRKVATSKYYKMLLSIYSSKLNLFRRGYHYVNRVIMKK